MSAASISNQLVSSCLILGGQQCHVVACPHLAGQGDAESFTDRGSYLVLHDPHQPVGSCYAVGFPIDFVGTGYLETNTPASVF